MEYNSLIEIINANIKANGRQAITGDVMNAILNRMVAAFGAGYQYMGMATPNLNPDSPDYKAFWLATEGTYTHMGGIEVGKELAVIKWDTAWSKEETGVVTTARLTEILSGYVTTETLTEALRDKQDTLISGENIKTINGQSVLGEGDIVIQSGSADAVKYTSQSLTDAQKEQARDNIGAAATSGYYPDMRVGEADYLPGTEVEQVEGISTVAKSTGLARIKEVKGKSLVWNQIIENGVNISFDYTNTSETDKYITASQGNLKIHPTAGTNKKLFIRADVTFTTEDTCGFYFSSNQSWSNNLFAGGGHFELVKDAPTLAGVVQSLMLFKVAPGAHVAGTITLEIIDLTQLFGSGNEPSTVAEFESWLANNIGYRDYYAYNPGEIISNNTEALEITGLNQWDEEWELGTISETGEAQAYASSIRTKFNSPIPVLPSTTYYFKSSNTARMYYYDAKDNFISRGSSLINNTTVTTPANCRYVRFAFVSNYGTTYKNDTIFSISGSRNGEYEPYQKSELELNLATITGKVNGEGESVVIFPDGMRSAGTAFDSLIVDEDGWCRKAVKVIGGVDMGTMNWIIQSNGYYFYASVDGFITSDAYDNFICAKYTAVGWSDVSSDSAYTGICLTSYQNRVNLRDTRYDTVANLKAALDGVYIFLVLATPLEYVLDTPIYMGIKTQQGGVIRQLPENGSAPTTAPIRMNITYALPPEALISGSSLENLLKALKSANKISNYTMTYNATSGKWEFTIS